jgi:hypothetical protein
MGILVLRSSSAPASATGVSGGVLTVVGSGFGSKSTAAPLFFETFESHSAGTLDTAIGLSTDNAIIPGGTTRPNVSTARSHSGTKSLRFQYPANPSTDEVFPKSYLPLSGVDEIYLRCWVYWSAVRGDSVQPIFKWSRGGSGAVYSGQPSFHETIFPNSSGVVADDAADCGFNVPTNQDTYDNNIAVSPSSGVWVFRQYKYKLGTANVANGFYVTECAQDGGTIGTNANLLNQVTRTNASQKIDWVMTPFDGISYGGGDSSYGNNSYDMYIDELYIDSSAACVIVTDNSTWASSTRFAVQPLLTWGSTEITATFNQGNLSSGTAYAHVWDSTGSYIGSHSFTVP